MMTVSSSLSAGFSHATRRLDLVILDLAFKVVWASVTLVVFFIAAIFFLSRAHVSQIGMVDFGETLRLVELSVVVRAVLENIPFLASIMAFAIALSSGYWFVQESFVRGGMVLHPKKGFWARGMGNCVVFFVSGFFRRSGIGLVVVMFGFLFFGPFLTLPLRQWEQTLQDMWWLIFIAAISASVLGFVLVLMDTLIRTDSLGMKGRIRQVLGVVAALLTLEMSLVLSAVVLIAFVFTRIEWANGVLATLIVGVLLSIAHSYLLLVRYCSVSIMRSYSSMEQVK